MSRNDPAALIRDEEDAIERVKNAIREGAVLSVTGKLVDLHPDTLCVHGDLPIALAFVRRIREELEQDDIAIKPVSARYAAARRCPFASACSDEMKLDMLR